MPISDKSTPQRSNQSGNDEDPRPIRYGISLRRFPLRAALLVIAALVVPVAAQATVIKQMASYGPQFTNWSGIPLKFNGFNTALGSLQSVILDATESFNGTADAKNTGNTSAKTSLRISNTGVVVNSSSNPSISIQIPDKKTSSTVTIKPGATSKIIKLSGSSSQSKQFTNNFSFFESPYTLTASDSSFEGLSSTGGNLTASFTDKGKVGVQALYTYAGHPVPAPGSLALFGGGLIALGWFSGRRRRQRSQS